MRRRRLEEKPVFRLRNKYAAMIVQSGIPCPPCPPQARPAEGGRGETRRRGRVHGTAAARAPNGATLPRQPGAERDAAARLRQSRVAREGGRVGG